MKSMDFPPLSIAESQQALAELRYGELHYRGTTTVERTAFAEEFDYETRLVDENGKLNEFGLCVVSLYERLRQESQ